MQAYEGRQREYASMGHKHFYFMTLNGSEVCQDVALMLFSEVKLYLDSI